MEKQKKLFYIGFLSVMFLFFLQLATMLIEAIYTVNLLGSSLNLYAAGVVWLLGGGFLVFVPLQIMVIKKLAAHQGSWLYRMSTRLFGPDYAKTLVYKRGAQFCAFLVVIFRLISPFLKTRPTIIIAGAGVFFFLLFYPLLLLQYRAEHHTYHGYFNGISLLGATLLSIVLRGLGATRDISLVGWTQLIGWAFAILAVWGALSLKKFMPEISEETPQNESEAVGSPTPVEGLSPAPSSVPTKSRWKAFSGAFGVLNLFIILIFGFESPTVFTRWTGGNYIAVNLVFTLTLCGAMLVLALKPALLQKFPAWAVPVWNLFFTAMVVLSILAHTIQFPAAPGSPVVVVGAVKWFQQIPLYLMLLSSPIIFVDFMLVVSRLARALPTLYTMAAGLSVGGLYFIIVIFMAIFTNVWGYVKPISNLFRNLYWLPYLIIGVFMALGAMSRKKSRPKPTFAFPTISRKAVVALVSLLLIGNVLGMVFFVPRPSLGDGGSTPVTSITVMTYNIQQGNNATGNKNYEAQLQVIRDSGADIIALEESDTARIGLGNNDIVRYFATALNYYSYYGPKTVTGTYGTAILSRYPITHAETIFSYSNKDETGTAYAVVDINGEEFHVFSSHPDGNDDNHRDHMNAIIDKITTENLDHVISMGDFNTRPFTEFYNISTAVLNDAWLTQYPTGIDIYGNNMTRRIDHIFLSSDFSVEGAWVIPEGPSQSDHNVFWATISW